MLAHDERPGQAALALGEADRLDAFGATAGFAVLADLGALAIAVLGDDEQVHVVARDVHRDHPPSLPTSMPRTPVVSRPIERASDSAKRTASPALRDHHDLVVGVDGAHGQQLVVIADVDRDDAVGFDRRVVRAIRSS